MLPISVAILTILSSSVYADASKITHSEEPAVSYTCFLIDAYGRNTYEGTGPTLAIAEMRAFKACEDDRSWYESVAKCSRIYIRDLLCEKYISK